MKAKTVQDSMVTIAHVMQPHEANIAGNVHGGVIMKLIDTTAGVVATRHARSNVVTASIDKLDFHYPAFIGDLVTFKASLNLVGNSSMEIGVRVDSENLLSGKTSHIASAYLTFVALGEDGKAVEVPRLILKNEIEEDRHRQAQERLKQRLAGRRRR